MSNIVYALDGYHVFYVLRFFKEDTGEAVDKNRLSGFVKSLVRKARDAADGEADCEEIDRTPLLLLHMNMTQMHCDLEVLSSPATPQEKLEQYQRVARDGPKEFLNRMMPLYVQSLTPELKFKGIVFKFADGQAYEADELFVAREIEFLVTLFFPENTEKK